MFPPPLRCIRRFFLPWPFLCRTGACFRRPGCFSACRARCPHRAAGWIFSQGYFAAPAASDFLDAQKVTKKAPGGGANRIRLRLILHAPHPLEPPLRGLPLGPDKNFRRAKSEWRSATSSGPTGALGLQKLGSGAVSQLRLALPSQRSRCESCAS